MEQACFKKGRAVRMIVYAADSKQGDRPYNEDCLKVKSRGENWLFVVCDGLGGMGHGEIASETAASCITQRFQSSKSYEHVLEDGVTDAQDRILRMQKDTPGYAGMATTAAALLITTSVSGNGKKVISGQWIHLGDSRIYLFRNRKKVWHTLDDSLPQIYVSLGEITDDEVRHHPDRSRLLRVIGSEWDEEAGFRYRLSNTQELQKGDCFLLCSDGFWEWISDRQMEECLEKAKDPSRWLNEMTSLVQKQGKGKNMDNYSAITVFVR